MQPKHDLEEGKPLNVVLHSKTRLGCNGGLLKHSGSMAVEQSCSHTLTSSPHIVQAQQQENVSRTNGEPKGLLILFSLSVSRLF